jgi:peptide deformylase
MIREIVKAGDKVLRTKSKPIKIIDKKVKRLICDLRETLVVQKDPEGVGLAAPQIGENLRIFAMKPETEVEIIINPEITEVSKSTEAPTKALAKKHKKIMEGCLSVPNYYTPLVRPFSVKIKYMDENGETKVGFYEGVNAQIVLHEIDHLNGVLFVDRMLEQKKTLFEYKKNGEWEEVEL